VLKVELGMDVTSSRLGQNSALLLAPEQVLPPVLEPLPVPRPLLGAAVGVGLLTGAARPDLYSFSLISFTCEF